MISNIYLETIHISKIEQKQILRSRWLCPLHIENEMIISVAIEGRNSLGRIFLPVVVDECKAFALACDFVLSKVDSSDATKRLK